MEIWNTRSRLKMALLFSSLLFACSDSDDELVTDKVVVRGLKTVLVSDQQDTTNRQYPSVLQPAALTVLSFETPGKLNQLSLAVGQNIEADEVLATLDTSALELQVGASEAALNQAKANAANAEADYRRKEVLRKDGIISAAEFDQAKTARSTSKAQVQQSLKQLESAQNNVEKSVLRAPFSGVISSVEVDSFATVGIGTPITSLYSNAAFEATFSVSFNVIDLLSVGKPVTVTLADRPDIELPGVISELGARADTVSSFPVVVSLEESLPTLKAGMAVGVGIEFSVPRGIGYRLPLQVLALNKVPDGPVDPNTPTDASLFVFNEASSTVEERQVQIGGVRENDVIIVGGINPGERIASAGVSFLKNGQKVKLLKESEQ